MIGNRIARSIPTAASSSSSPSLVSAARTALLSHLGLELDGIRSAGTFKHERVIITPQGAHIRTSVPSSSSPLASSSSSSSLSSSPALSSSPLLLNFCANNYLGLSNSPVLKNAAKAAIDSHGMGLSSVRFICGTQDIHKKLERKIAEFHGVEDAILYASCFDANAGIFETLFNADDCIISDTLNHASIIDGIRLSKARRLRYQHIDMADLEKQLLSSESTSARHRVIVTDGVFSMDGHVAPLDKIVELAEKHKALIFVDECHATGFFGATGRGTDEYCGVQGKIDFINSTLGKALGGTMGGYTAASQQVVDLLRQRSRPYLFSNTLPPAVVGSTIACFDLISNSNELVQKLAANTRRFRAGMTAAGFDLAGSTDHPIVPIMLGDAKHAAEFAEAMLSEGVYVIAFSYPVVPKGAARIRTQISAAHSEEDIDHAIKAFSSVKQRLAKQSQTCKKQQD